MEYGPHMELVLDCIILFGWRLVAASQQNKINLRRCGDQNR